MVPLKGLNSAKMNDFHQKEWLPLKGRTSAKRNGPLRGMASTKKNGFH